MQNGQMAEMHTVKIKDSLQQALDYGIDYQQDNYQRADKTAWSSRLMRGSEERPYHSIW